MNNPLHRSNPISVSALWLAAGCAFCMFNQGKTLGRDVSQPITEVEVATKPGKEWKRMPVRTLSTLPPLELDHDLDQYGGLNTNRRAATGFFRVEKVGDRWWLVDPLGGLFINKGVVSVRATPTDSARKASASKYGSQENWAAETTKLLREHGFNGLGSWSDLEALGAVEKPLVQTQLWTFMASYGKKRGGTFQLPGHVGYPNDCPFFFDKEFETFCDEYAQKLSKTKDDPNLLGVYSDNELPWKRTLLNNCLTLPESDPGYKFAFTWMKNRHGENAGAADITEQDQIDFLGIAADRYFSIVSKAIRKYDPNHLYLGARFHEVAFDFPEVFAAAGRYIDVVTVNYYRAWSPKPEHLAMWERESKKPLLITEWYAKAEDSGMGNTGGAGWLVRTQAERGIYYQNFIIGLMESKVCVGWHWFKYMDNDPTDKKVDPSNRDSNKGILTNRYESYQQLLDAMKALNDRSYSLVSYLDGVSATPVTLNTHPFKESPTP